MATPQERTRAFARVLGPFIAIVPGVLVVRVGEVDTIVEDLFSQPLMVWGLGAILLGGGLVIIGLHRNWRGPAAVAVSLFGWFVALRGVLMLAAPQTIETGAGETLSSPGLLLAARVFFGLLAAGGLYLAYVGWFAKDARRAA